MLVVVQQVVREAVLLLLLLLLLLRWRLLVLLVVLVVVLLLVVLLLGRRRSLAVGVVLLVLAVLDFVEVVDGARVAAAGHAILADGGQDHALAEALAEAAVLAPVALRLGDLAVAVGHARVHALVLHRPLEEALASARGSVSFR